MLRNKSREPQFPGTTSLYRENQPKQRASSRVRMLSVAARARATAKALAPARLILVRTTAFTSLLHNRAGTSSCRRNEDHLKRADTAVWSVSDNDSMLRS